MRKISIDNFDMYHIKMIRRIHNVNVIVGHVTDEDIDLFLGPIQDDDVAIMCGQTTHLAPILKALGVFSSSSQARKAGWDKEIPPGYSHFPRVSKFRIDIFCLNFPIDHVEL